MNITLHFSVKRYQRSGYKAAVDIECKATSACNVDTNVFVIQKLPNNFNKQPDYRFSHVADPVDMQDYPTDKMDDYAYFRTDSIKLRVRNDFQAQHAINGIKTGVTALVKALNYLSSAQATAFQFTTGTSCSDSISASLSESGSESVSESISESVSQSQSYSFSYSESSESPSGSDESDTMCIYGMEFDIIQQISPFSPSDSSTLPVNLCSHTQSDALIPDTP